MAICGVFRVRKFDVPTQLLALLRGNSMAAPTHDLFDDTTMTFGEHLEALRWHLLRGLLWLLIGFVISLTFSRYLIISIQAPVNRALLQATGKTFEEDLSQEPSLWDQMVRKFSSQPAEPAPPAKSALATEEEKKLQGMTVQIDAVQLAQRLHQAIPAYPEPPAAAPPVLIELPVRGHLLTELLKEIRLDQSSPRTDTPDEAFMIYMIVSVVVGFVIASPFIFYEIWQFVAAGLYPHERAYIYRYLPLSITLFLGGALFCFFFVLPAVLKFLFTFNVWLELRPEIKIGMWIKFALVVSVLFGLSFQLPLVMVLLERISIFSARDYRDKWRYSVLAMSFLSMVLTPSDPVSMTMMLVPLCMLYFFGIWLCERGARGTGFEAEQFTGV